MTGLVYVAATKKCPPMLGVYAVGLLVGLLIWWLS